MCQSSASSICGTPASGVSDLSVATGILAPPIGRLQLIFPGTGFNIQSNFAPIEQTQSAFDIGIRVGRRAEDTLRSLIDGSWRWHVTVVHEDQAKILACLNRPGFGRGKYQRHTASVQIVSFVAGVSMVGEFAVWAHLTG